MSEPATGLQELREKLVAGCHILDDQGVVDSSGHLSVRVPGTNTYLMPGRGAPGLAADSSILLMDEDGQILDGSGLPPLEWPIHGRLYREREDVNSILHSHSPMSRVFSISSVSLRPVYGIAASWFHETIGISGVSGPVTNSSAGSQLANELGAAPAILLRAHGNVVVGSSIEAATVRAITLEQVAQSLYRALSIGPVEYLSEAELREWRSAGSGGDGKAWAYYRAQLGRRPSSSRPAHPLEEEAHAR